MKIKHFFTFLSLLVVFSAVAQSSKEAVLFTVGSDSVYASEFIRVYQKNLDLVQDESQKDVDEYLKLFTNYKLKIKEARSLGFHEKPGYQKELESYKKQLAKSYLSDSKVTDALVEEAYERMTYDVNANHILVKVSENASPQDTIAAYNQILKLRERTLNEGFEEVRKEVHNGKTVYGETLGYFSGFKMVYEFESVAYNTPVGGISMPFRTRFGYHILNVIDKRKSEGEREVGHIMIMANSDANDSIVNKAEERINEIYAKINQGEAFEALAKQFSEDKNSAPKGGKLRAFSRGQLSAQEFENVAFSLEKVRDISKPFQTQFGWHIVKLYDIKLVPNFETMKPELITKVQRDSRSKLIDQALVDNLKAKYGISDEQLSLSYFESILNDDYFKNSWKLPSDFISEKPMLTIGKKQINYKDFGDYLLETQRQSRKQIPISTLVDEKYQSFLKNNLITYQEENLETENSEYASVVHEYRDGLLLFELMESTIWNTAQTDSVAIKNYYETHKEDYFFPERIDAIIAASPKKKTLKKVSKLLEENKDLETIKSEVNTNDIIEIIFTSDVVEADHQGLPKDFEFKKGVSKIFKHNDGYVVVVVNEVFPEKQKTFEEAQGQVVNDYQAVKEEKWIDELSTKYEVTVNQDVFKKVKEQLK
ncbi:peptidylprolyl isomerase [Tamlana sp. 2_MG-2023]|uniref:peptidylprolyl isomerase n=1 Tax=unclassified Tamlana TaxID=2614803 RepID=UPI0026E1461F|nr:MULTISPECIES: peptidylprolyl isomerase [unclassified Tamlana]MDO6758998.1 peptidylprolyl isomerase [Tamlana sp. 2_MG-2023]MDO6789697.1 peptidylprolyl isomerase [Tamlana sp. 1_MG-2023]